MMYSTTIILHIMLQKTNDEKRKKEILHFIRRQLKN